LFFYDVCHICANKRQPLPYRLTDVHQYVIMLINTGGFMQFLTIREFSRSPKFALSKLTQDGKAVLTNNGKPAAIIISVNTESFERTLNLVQEVEKRDPVRIRTPAISDEERAEAFERLMNFPRKKLPPDFDPKKELAEWRDERFGPID
jgi:PHD/YefM family antitoxin component YafN of YafNO toxin-antitoxin module